MKRFSVRQIRHGIYEGLWMVAPRNRMPLLEAAPTLRKLPVERLHSSWHEAFEDASRKAFTSRT